MLNQDIPQGKLDDLKLAVFDSDGVTIPRGTKILEKVSDGLISVKVDTFVTSDEFSHAIHELSRHVKICICSGRSMIYLQSMYRPLLAEGALLQAENGNISLIDGTLVQHEDYDTEYFKLISQIQLEIQKLPIKGVEPKQFILSVHAEEEHPEVYEIVSGYDTKDELKVMWNGEAFDIQRKNVSKGEGVTHLADSLNINPDQIIAIGDRINDKEMIETAGIGVSADIDALKADYWTTGDDMPGLQLARYLLDYYSNS